MKTYYTYYSDSNDFNSLKERVPPAGAEIGYTTVAKAFSAAQEMIQQRREDNDWEDEPEWETTLERAEKYLQDYDVVTLLLDYHGEYLYLQKIKIY
jgi:hypothetical protein